MHHYSFHQILTQLRRGNFSPWQFYSVRQVKSFTNVTKLFFRENSFLYSILGTFKDKQTEVISAMESDKMFKEESSIHTSKSKNIISLPKGERNIKKFAKLAASKIATGNVIAVPTDTIYGLACLVQNGSAIRDLYSIKSRHPDKPVSVCVAEIEDIYRWGHVTVSLELLQEILPGPVTLCFSRKSELNVEFNPEAELVGIRIPDHLFVREVCRNVQSYEGCCGPIALTSANVSGSDSCLQIKEFAEELFSRSNSKLETIFDGGRLGETRLSRLGSTIVDLSTKGYYKIIRQGSAEQNTVKILKKHGLLEQVS